MVERTYCVYQIYNKIENKSYIGSTCNIRNRLTGHKNGTYKWQQDYRQHPENYEVNILEDNISEDDISLLELFYIDYYDSVNNGYNKTYITNTRKNIKKKTPLTDNQKRNLDYCYSILLSY